MKRNIAAVFAIVVSLFAAGSVWAQKPELAVQTGHAGVVMDVAFSADGKRMASGGMDKTAILWDVETGKQLRVFAGHAEFITAVAFSPDGRVLVTGGTDDTIKLWNAHTGKELRTLAGHRGNVLAVAFSPDGEWLASASGDQSVRLWGVKDGKERLVFAGHTAGVTAVKFSRDGRWVVSGGDDKSVRVWEAATGKELRAIITTGKVRSVAISSDGNLLASAGGDKTAKLWEAATGKELRALAGHTDDVSKVMFSADGVRLFTLSISTIKVWEAATGKELATVTEKNLGANSMALDSETKTLAVGSLDNTVKLWDAATGKKVRVAQGYAYPVRSIAFSPDGRVLASARLDGVKLWDAEQGGDVRTVAPSFGSSVHSIAFSPDGKVLAVGATFEKALAGLPAEVKKQLGIEDETPTVKLLDVKTGKTIHKFAGHTDAILALAFSPDGRVLASASADKTIKVRDTQTGAELYALTAHAGKVNALAFSPDGKTFASASADKTVRVWDAQTGKEVRAITGLANEVNALSFSADGKTLAAGAFAATTLWDAETGKEIRAFAEPTNTVNAVLFSKDGRQLMTAGFDNLVRVRDLNTGKEVRQLTGHSNTIMSLAFAPTQNVLASAGADAKIKLWDAASGEELASLIALGDSDWAAVTPDGRFDASAAGMRLMHWVVGSEAIELAQLKERYYEPRLLAKLLGFNREPLRQVGEFGAVQLAPGITHELIDGGAKLRLKVRNRGGGIGRVQVFVNDKELVADARDAAAKENPDAEEIACTVDLANAPVVPGAENRIRVVTWNADDYLSSRGATLAFVADDKTESAPPQLYAIIGGISDYASPALQLRYAAKDAEDFARALELGAKRLLGADKVHLTLLTTSKPPRATTVSRGVTDVAVRLAPTKANFKRAFEQARRARPTDIFVVYLAGHGVSLMRGGDLYCYLTENARSNDAQAYMDAEVRAATGITSDELTEWVKQIPALKQIMILDTCAAGAAQSKLTEKRAVPTDQIRAIERLKDRTGFHVLMGSAADAVSYEATQFEQGLLTYALLQGIRGAALRNGEFVDVSRLFQFAADQVPQLAQSIGGIQKPVIAAPRGTSFDIGLLKKEDRDAVPLTAAKPMIVRPVLLNAAQGFDNLDLMAQLRKQFLEESYAGARGGAKPAAVYVDAEELAGAIRPSGTYVVRGATVEVQMVLRRDNRTIRSFRVVGSKRQPRALVARITRQIALAVQPREARK